MLHAQGDLVSGCKDILMEDLKEGSVSTKRLLSKQSRSQKAFHIKQLLEEMWELLPIFGSRSMFFQKRTGGETCRNTVKPFESLELLWSHPAGIQSGYFFGEGSPLNWQKDLHQATRGGQQHVPRAVPYSRTIKPWPPWPKRGTPRGITLSVGPGRFTKHSTACFRAVNRSMDNN